MFIYDNLLEFWTTTFTKFSGTATDAESIAVFFTLMTIVFGAGIAAKLVHSLYKRRGVAAKAVSRVFGPRCLFCGDRSRFLEAVVWDTKYNQRKSRYIKQYRHYHQYKCLANILKRPDTFEDATVRLALRLIKKKEQEEYARKRDRRTDAMRKLRKLSERKYRNEKAKKAYREMS